MNLNDALAAVDTATSKLGVNVTTLSSAADGISTRIAAMADTISTSMTAEDVAAAKATLDTETSKLDLVSLGLDHIATALDGMATSPTTPVPPLPDPPAV